MNKSAEEVIFCRIVANLLYKRITGISITFSNLPHYDLVVEEKQSGLVFGVKVGMMDYPSTDMYREYLELLEKSKYVLKEERLPIILMCADKESENIRFGYQLTWERYRASVQTKVTLRDITPETWDEMVFHRMISGIPEDEYPNDILDEVILKGVDSVYPNPRRKSQVLLLNTELMDLKRNLECAKKVFNIRIEPEYSDLINYNGFIQSFRILEIPLTLYHEPIKIFDDTFSDEYPAVTAPVTEWIQNYGILEKLRNETLRSVSDVVTELT